MPGVIITPSDITDFVPWLPPKIPTCMSQGQLRSRNCRTVKNGFLGFENSYTYKDTVKLVKYRNGIDLDPCISYR
jgi:DNA polymerase-3 subunit alpha